MKKTYSYIGTLNVVLAMAICLLNTAAPAQTNASESDHEAPQFSNKPPPPGFATRIDYLKSFTNEKDILNARRAGLINEDESILALEALESKMKSKPMDTYGKVVDQGGQPLVGVKVQSHLEVGIGSYDELDTQTDVNGQFRYVGHRGLSLIMRFHKAGYEFNENLLPERPKNYLPDPDKPLIITMWKLHGPEPMRYIQINSDVPCDGSVKRFDLLSSVQKGAGDLSVRLTRNPLNIVRGKPFDWLVTLAVTNGGLQEATNIYPNEAPAEGYQPSITLNFPANMAGWQYEFKHCYYFKSKDGQVYGRMTIDIQADRPSPPTYFNADIYANPAGSHNLEFDPKKQILR
jgi:hypothetical protein